MIFSEEEYALCHYGVKNMKWGVRKVVKAVGSATKRATKVLGDSTKRAAKVLGDSAKNAYSKLAPKIQNGISKRRINNAVKKNSKKALRKLSDEEVKKVLDRLALEKQYEEAKGNSKSAKARSIVQEALLGAAKTYLNTAGTAIATEKGKQLAEKVITSTQNKQIKISDVKSASDADLKKFVDRQALEKRASEYIPKSDTKSDTKSNKKSDTKSDKKEAAAILDQIVKEMTNDSVPGSVTEFLSDIRDGIAADKKKHG